MVNTLQFFCLVLGLSLTAGPVEQSALSEVIGSSSAASEASETDADVQKIPDIEAGILDITKYGNITLTIGPDSMEDLGYEPADLILVRIGDSEMEMPIGTAYTDADSGDPLCCFKSGLDGKDYVILAINGGNLTKTMGFAEFHAIDEDPGFEWVFLNGLDDSAAVHISMVEKQGYADEYSMHKLGNARLFNREECAQLSDAEYANFRVIETTGMGTGTLYRSSSPVNPILDRNEEADEALLNAGIRVVINMPDSESALRKYPDYGLTSYSDCEIIALNMALDFTSEDFMSKLAEGLRFIISHDGPYLIHCIEGKDRTGFVAAVLECMMGADVEEIVEDYMISFYNFYGVEPGTEQYDQIAKSNIESTLARVFGVGSIRDAGVDLQACAEAYLLDTGMSEEEIAALKDRLGEDYGGGF